MVDVPLPMLTKPAFESDRGASPHHRGDGVWAPPDALDAVVQTTQKKGTLLQAPSDANKTLGPTWPKRSATARAPKSGEHDVHVAPVEVAPSIATTASPTFAT